MQRTSMTGPQGTAEVLAAVLGLGGCGCGGNVTPAVGA